MSGAVLLHQFRPRLRAAGIAEITPELLSALGISALILDLDNTLVPWHGQEVPPDTTLWIARMRDAGLRLCIVSNTHRPRRLNELSARLEVACVPSGGKPGRRGFLRAIEAMEATVEETAVIGDQLMTDIWGGNRCGLLTILVDPMSPVEFWGTRAVSRRIERLLLRALEKRGWAPQPAVAAGLTGCESEGKER